MVCNKFLPKLSQNFLEILDDDEYYDITIEVGNDPYVKIFRAHMAILYYRSSYLRRILSTNKKKIDGTLSHIKLPNIIPEIFKIILEYIYGGRISLEEYDISDVIKILNVAGVLGLQELVDYLQSFLIENETSWIEQNFNLLYQTSFERDSLLDLQKFCTDLMSKEPEKIFKSLDFVSIPERSLVSLIQNDNLQMREVQVWGHVLKWGLAQNPELSSDPSSYSKENFNTLKNTLQPCIPFIRFYNLTSKEFSEKVYPYKKILSKELCDDLFRYFLDPRPNNKSRPRGINNISTNIDSKIISNKHAELISKWIDDIDTFNNSPASYEFKLIFRESRDSRKFHVYCNDHSRTVTIIKVKGSNEILGGYNPIKWISGNSYDINPNSFIFSFNGKNIENYILSRVKDENYILSRIKNETRAIYNNSVFYAPSFGYSDLVIRGGSCYNYSYCSKCDYEKQIRETNDYFSVEDYEVFQII